jgi:hypothetical protein
MASTLRTVTSSTSHRGSTSVWLTKEAHDDHGAVKFRPTENVRKLTEKVQNMRTPYEKRRKRIMAETLKAQPLISLGYADRGTRVNRGS